MLRVIVTADSQRGNFVRNLTKVLMVSTEYPPMMDGVGRYTYNLTKGLRKLGLGIHVVCDETERRFELA
jgi:hypothetical protein